MFLAGIVAGAMSDEAGRRELLHGFLAGATGVLISQPLNLAFGLSLDIGAIVFAVGFGMVLGSLGVGGRRLLRLV